MKIALGFLGAGEMGSSIIKRIKNTYTDKKFEINIYDHHPEKLLNISANINSNLSEMVENSDIIFLAVKPHQVEKSINELKQFWRPELVLVSICAGITLDSLSNLLGSNTKLVRTIPSITCLTGKGSTSISFRNINNEEKEIIIQVFECCGSVHNVEERDIDCISAISGSGPAFVALFLESIIDAGVKNGIKRTLATSLAVETLEGTCALINELNFHPALIKEKVTSPGGTTITGISILERERFRYSIISAISETTEKAKNIK